MSEITIKYKRGYLITKSISIIMTIGPLLYYLIVGFSIAEPTKRVILSLSAISALFLMLINVIFKLRIRSVMFILLLGIHSCINNITNLILILAATTFLDEVLFVPMCNYCKSKYEINKEIDKRS